MSDKKSAVKTVEKEPEFVAADGTVRKAHYGDGEQPWDIIVKNDWGPVFAACNALKYVRRYKAKNGEDDLEKGRWYYAELTKFGNDKDHVLGMIVKIRLDNMLSNEERALLSTH